LVDDYMTISTLVLYVWFLLLSLALCVLFFFFFKGPATTEIYTLSLHDALPISGSRRGQGVVVGGIVGYILPHALLGEEVPTRRRSEEHTSELQSRFDLVCRLLLEKKKNYYSYSTHV